MSIAYNSSIVTDGLIVALDAANPKSYPGTGTAWTDISGNGNHGTLTNGAAFSSSNGGSIVFNGVNHYVDLNFPFTQSTTGNVYTIFAAAKLSNTSSARRQIWASDNGGFDWGFGSGDGTNYIIFSGEGSYSGKAQDTNWHIFTAQWSNSFGIRLYVDNVLEISSPNISYDSSISTNTSIGRNPGGSEYWNGNIALVQLYNRVLTTAEITKNFNALRGRYGI